MVCNRARQGVAPCKKKENVSMKFPFYLRFEITMNEILGPKELQGRCYMKRDTMAIRRSSKKYEPWRIVDHPIVAQEKNEQKTETKHLNVRTYPTASRNDERRLHGDHRLEGKATTEARRPSS